MEAASGPNPTPGAGSCQTPPGIPPRSEDTCTSGVKTGQCVEFNGTHRSCEIQACCLMESNTVPVKPLLLQAENSTLFIKNTVTFSKFNFSRTAAHWWEGSGVETPKAMGSSSTRSFNILITGQITFFCDLLLLYVDEETHFSWRTKSEEESCGPA
ncbi:hypothetical protein HPG69_016538 [Diceros bicornis minor]|uniref:Uncharacterized protein n=1 Tax=Diceros bicornis minor TaxID=77932 RepID=A0A7J7F4V3_DICBM|nr:hypothetical protein HPG69_016538 [Diceros bicornis minor]